MISIFDYYPELKQNIPYIKEFSTIHFNKTFQNTYTLSYSKANNLEDYENFKELIYSNIGKKYFPVLRMSDGEMLLLTGAPGESRRASYIKRLERYKNEGLGEITLNDKGEPTGKYKEFLEKPENQLQITKEVAVGFVQNLVNGDYSNEQIQLKIKQVFGVENVVKINKLLEDLK